jgi:anti-sigma regulatory factor (Ser/Thr protein kinase)
VTPQAPTTTILSLDLPCAPDAPATVRAALRGTESESPDVLLVASELVTNAVVHSGCDPDHLLNVHVSKQSQRVLISVHDPGVSRLCAAPRPAGQPGVGGWGLRLVAQLSERWGADRPSGYRVWAEVAVGR